MASRSGFRLDKGTLQTRMRHARAFLGINDQMRLEMLVNVPADKLLSEGRITVPKARKLRTEKEERDAMFRAVRDEIETLLAKANRAPHAAERKDPIGRAWYEGLLEGHGVDSTVLRELGREYGGLYWSELRQLNIQMPGYDARVGRPNVKRKFIIGGLTGNEAARFQTFENIIAPLGHNTRKALQRLCVDDIWFLDGPEWLDRCIATHRKGRGLSADGPGATFADKLTLQQAIRALVALAQGVSR